MFSCHMVKSRKKAKNKQKYLIFGAISIFTVLLASTFVFYYLNSNNQDIKASRVNYDLHIGKDQFVEFNIKNPTETDKSCTYNVITDVGEYISEEPAIIQAKTKQRFRVKVDFPEGRSDVNIKTNCKNTTITA